MQQVLKEHLKCLASNFNKDQNLFMKVKPWWRLHQLVLGYAENDSV